MNKRRQPEIPMDVVMGEILTRLPAKSLMRFKCVSKDCSSLICSLYFNNRFLTVPSRTPPRLHMCLVDHNDSVTLSLAPDTASCFVVENDLTIPQMGCSSIQNLRGFRCYTYKEKPRIYNPTTRQLITLPKAPLGEGHDGEIIAYNFGHASVSNRYIVICSATVFFRKLQEIMCKHLVFVQKRGGGGSWSKVNPTPPDFHPHIPDKGGVCIDAVIYYLSWNGLYKDVLVSFDIRSEDFNMIQVPDRNVDEQLRNLSLIEYGGKVSITDQTHLRDKGMLDLWIIEDVRNKKWSKKTLVLKSSQLHLVNDNITKFDVKGTTKNGVVFLIQKTLLSPFHILCCDLQNNDIRKIEIRDVPDHWLSKDGSTVNVIFMDYSESLEFLGHIQR